MYVTVYDFIVLIATLKYQLSNGILAVLVLQIALSFLAHRLDSLGSNHGLILFALGLSTEVLRVTRKASILKCQEGLVSTVKYLFY